MAYSIERMPERISIGRETETGVTDVMIDCGAWVSKWPGMALHAIYTPEGGAPYILQTETDGGVLVWHVTDADTATPGTGRMEIVGETDGRRKVSAMVKVYVAARMSGTVGEPPEAAKPWADRVVEAAERITGMQVQAETLDAGSSATAEWDGEQGLLTIGVPKGEKGEKGPQGEKGEPGKDAVVDDTLTQHGQAADAKATGDAVNQLKDEIVTKADKTAIARTDRKLDALWKLNEGISYQFETDNNEAYQKHVISGAKLADIQSVGGKTVVWNQLFNLGNSRTIEKNGITFTINKSTGTIVVNGTATANTHILLYEIKVNRAANKYYMSGCPQGGSISTYYVGGNYIWIRDYNVDTGNSIIVNDNSALRYSDNIGIMIKNGTTVSNLVFKPRLINLTKMFGAGNEPTSTDDSRIAWIEQYAAAHPEYNAGELVSADVESIKYNNAIIADIPASVRALPGYGWSAGSVYNSIERTESGWQYIQRVGSVDLGTLDWYSRQAGTANTFRVDTPNMGIKGSGSSELAPNAISIYTIKPSKDYAEYDNVLAIHSNGDYIYAAFNRYGEDVAAFKTAISGVMLYYELKEPIITDITDLMDGTIDAIAVEAGGTLTFENAAKLPVPNSVEYAVKLSEVGA